MSQIEWALRYFDAGWQIMPCAEKKPFRAAFEAWDYKWEWMQSQRPTRKIVEWWWQKWPNAQIALICGAISGVTVIDIDTHVDVRKWPNVEPESVEKIFCEKVGISISSITGSGGRHVFSRYAKIGNSSQDICPQIDIKSDGGYVILPESFHHEAKKNYEWDRLFPFSEENIKHGLSTVPVWILRRATDKAENNWSDILNGVGSGSRNTTLAKVVGKLLLNLKPEDAWKLVVGWNRAYNTPPLDEREVLVTFKSICKTHYARHRYPLRNR